MRRLENRVRLIPLVGGRFVISLLSGQQPLRQQREAATTSGDVHAETTRSDHAAGCGVVAFAVAAVPPRPASDARDRLPAFRLAGAECETAGRFQARLA